MELKWKKRLSFFSIVVFFFMEGVQYAVILPTLWLYLKTEFHAQEYMLGLLLSGFSFTAIICGPIFGSWADKSRRPKILVLLGIVFEVVGSIMYFMGISVWFLLASRLVAGVGGGAETVVLGEVTRTSDEKKRTGIISVLVAIRQTGLLIGPGLNLFLRHMDFTVDGFHVYKYNIPGAFMAVVWVIVFFIFLLFYTDLHRLNIDPKIEKTLSNGTTASSHDDALHTSHHSNQSRVDYDEDIYKEIVSSDMHNTDRKSINSASSRSPLTDPDDLIETAEDFIVDRQRRSSNSNTPSVGKKTQGSMSGAAVSNGTNGASRDTNSGVAIDTPGYGTFEGSILIPNEESQNCRGSREYILNREESVVEFTQGKLKFMYHEYVREEIVTVIAVQFNSFFNQISLETMVTPLSDKILHWGELENSLMYCGAGVIVILTFVLVTWMSKRVQDRYLILAGSIILTVANTWLIYVIPNADKESAGNNIWKFTLGVVLDTCALPLLVSGSISLYSKVTRKEMQGFSMGLRRSVVGIATILAPLWTGSTITRPYIMFGVMLALLLLSLVMLSASFSKLRPTSELPVNKAGLITASNSDADESQPLLN